MWKKKIFFLKCEQVHRCRLREQDLAIKNPVIAEFLLLRSAWARPAPSQPWTVDVCAYLLNSLEHRAAFLCNRVHL